MAEDKGKRVRGAKQVRQRTDWLYPIDHGEWIDQLNAVRRRLGDRTVSELLGYSTRDPSYKSVRRLASGSRVPNADRVSEVNRLFESLFEGIKTIFLPPEIRGEVVGTMTTTFRNRMEAFILRMRGHAYRFDPARGIGASEEASEKMNSPHGALYVQAVNKDGDEPTARNNVVALLLVYVNDKRKGGIYTEARILQRIEPTGEGLLKNMIDTHIEKIPESTDYIEFAVLGVWYVYY